MFRKVLLAALVAVAFAQRELIRPDPQACVLRKRHSTLMPNGHYYFFSWRHGPTSNHERDWLDARNICRKHCQDLVSLETPEEAQMVENFVRQDNVKYIWTSGRKCNFDGCDRKDLQPIDVNGWFWSGSEEKMPPTNRRNGNYPNWSNTGGAGRPQPDNREQKDENGEDEACLGILNNFYNDGVKWHDIACYHEKPWVCEDSESLLAFVRSRNPTLNI